jgi:hypothetical protein
MEWITKQGMFGVVAAVAGVAAGIFLSRIIRRRRDAAAQPPGDAEGGAGAREEGVVGLCRRSVDIIAYRDI